MAGRYYIEFTEFSLSQLQERICNSILIPSHRILLEEIQTRFEALQRVGVTNLDDLFNRCSTARKMVALAAEATIPEEYLVILNRHAGVYRPQPNDLTKIPGLNADYLAVLISQGFKNTRLFWETSVTREQRANLATLTGLPTEFLYEVACHSDLTRAGYVGPVFSRLLYESGATTIRKMAGYDPENLFELTLQVNREKQYTRVGYLLKDIAWCVDYARLLPWVLEEE